MKEWMERNFDWRQSYAGNSGDQIEVDLAWDPQVLSKESQNFIYARIILKRTQIERKKLGENARIHWLSEKPERDFAKMQSTRDSFRSRSRSAI
jgi:hypothetical protein